MKHQLRSTFVKALNNLFLSATLIAITAPVGAAIMIDLGSQPIALLPDLALQQVILNVSNPDGTDFFSTAATLKFVVDDGTGGGNAPVITGIDALNLTPWSSAGGIQNNQTTNPEFWDVRVFANFLGGQSAKLPANSSTRLAKVTFDTTGLSSGTWTIKMSALNVDPQGSKYEVFGGGTHFPDVTVGSITLLAAVPEPAETALISGLALLGVGVARRYRKNKRSQRAQ